MATIGGVDLGTVQSERQAKIGQLFQQPIPTQDSDAAILLDIFGMSRSITLSGVLNGTLSDQNTFIQAIESIMNGEQIGSTFVSSQTSTPNKLVFIDSFEWTVEEANSAYISYSITLIEGAATA